MVSVNLLLDNVWHFFNYMLKMELM
jgi:hypothetical protein